MTNPSDDTGSIERLAARLLDAEKEVASASTALLEFVRAGERYSASSKTLDEAVVALAPVGDSLQLAVSSLGSAVSALQASVATLQGADAVRLRQEIGERIAALNSALGAFQTQMTSAASLAQEQRIADNKSLRDALIKVVQVVEARTTDGFAAVAKQASDMTQEQHRQREQDRAMVASLSASMVDQSEALRRVTAQLEASEARLTKRVLGGFAVLGVGLAFIAYRLLMN